MKKIREKHSDRDRIICVSLPGYHQFYYQAKGSQKRKYLFETDFSGSVFAFFREKGCNMSGCGFSLTIKQLYQFHNYSNVKLARIMERIPAWIDFVLKEELELERVVPEPIYTIAKECSDEHVA